MKLTGIWIDYKNAEQVAWWNNIGSKLVKVAFYNEIVETATGKPVGVLMNIKGLLSRYVIKQNEKFIKNPVTAVFERKD